MKSEVYNMSCIEGMKRYPDKFFDLAVVDPPYGIGEDGASNHTRNKAFGSKSVAKNNTRGTVIPAKKYTPKEWDNEPPSPAYFLEVFRVSKNQIVWGANHFISRMPYDSSCWIVWDKDNSGDFADCELACTSFKTAVRKFKWRWNGMLQEDMKNKETRIHPTQKPVALYDWIFQKYAEKGMKILDTHLGSQSSRIAAHKNGLDFWGFEIDKEYFDQGCKRYEDYLRRPTLFQSDTKGPEVVQTDFFFGTGAGCQAGNCTD